MALLYAVHDQSGHALVPAGGWCVESIAIAENPQPQNWTQIRPDINWILRLNWAHNGKDGTIPLRGQYDEFAKRCADYMAHTGGVQVVIIANEPNHAQEYPHGVPIAPEDYADCFNGCYRTITYERPDCEVMAAAVAPWDVTSGIDWLAYYKRMLAPVTECDGLAIHGYTHGADPNLIWSTEKTHGWYWHFPVIYQTIQAIPPRFATRPVHVTETDQGDNAWVDANSGWVQNAYQSVDDHNRTPGTQKIYSLALYRWRGDKYEIHNKPLVQEDFKAAVKRGYISPGEPMPTPPQPQPPRPQPPQPPTPTPEPEPARDIDPRLLARGVEFDFVTPPAGTGYWRITKAQWLDHAASQVGPDHHILGRVLKDNVETAGVVLRVWWPSGTTTVTSKRDDPNATYNYDYGMSASLNEYSITVNDGNLSDKASGIGMGANGNPREHTSTWINFEWTISGGLTPPPVPSSIETGRVTARAGLNLRRGPGEGFDALGTLAYGSTVLHDDEQAGWLHVIDGWVSAEYVGAAQGAETVTQELPLVVDDGLAHPLPASIITQHFYQNPPDYAQWDLPGHDGTDLGGMAEGTPIGSIAAGIVVDASVDKAYGKYVVVRHPGLDACSFYAHLNEIKVGGGQEVAAGETIGLLGATGNATGPHLHLEIRMINADGSYRQNTPMRGGRVDPQTWCCLHGLRL
jgi:hypothetical protein